MCENCTDKALDVSYLSPPVFDDVRAVFVEGYKGQITAIKKQQEALRREIAALDCQRREIGKIISVLGGDA
jgi:hypothetical protein